MQRREMSEHKLEANWHAVLEVLLPRRRIKWIRAHPVGDGIPHNFLDPRAYIVGSLTLRQADRLQAPLYIIPCDVFHRHAGNVLRVVPI